MCTTKKLGQNGECDHASLAECSASYVARFSNPDCPSDKNPDYPMVVGVPDRSYVWIMSRKTEMDENLYNEVVQRCKSEWEYDIEKLVKVEQKW